VAVCTQYSIPCMFAFLAFLFPRDYRTRGAGQVWTGGVALERPTEGSREWEALECDESEKSGPDRNLG
jgi:hypothetical protein